jgi:imidazolonepropionase-like amidohydrolase
MMLRVALLVATLGLQSIRADAQSPKPFAIVGGTLIDGTGREPVRDAVVVVRGDRIAAAGPRGSISVPRDATVIDAAGKFVTPGFIDTNVHLSLYGGAPNDRYETLVRYEHRQPEIVLEAAQTQLKYGVTTVRDSYGVLAPLVHVRDAIARGEAIGPRVLVAGNIVGWGGPFSLTFSLIPQDNLTLFQERMNEQISQGAGEELAELTPDELRPAINAYLDRGPDFIKYGGTAHFSLPVLLGFSFEQQRVIVEETHRRGRVAETHATSAEGLRLAVEAGVDLIQHPEIVTPRELPDDIARLIADRGVICSMLVNTMTGAAWQEHLKKRAAAGERIARDTARTGHRGTPLPRERTVAERRRDWAALEEDLELRRRNAQKLIAAGCTVTIGTDNYFRAAPELARGPKPEYQDHGIGTIIGIEGLVELGMTPMQALVAATRNGAQACRLLDSLGTIEPGKYADLLVLDADPLEDIRNTRRLNLVVKGGRVVDATGLPEKPVFYRSP